MQDYTLSKIILDSVQCQKTKEKKVTWGGEFGVAVDQFRASEEDRVEMTSEPKTGAVSFCG